MWTPQAIVAVVLAFVLVLMIVGAIISRFTGYQPTAEMLQLWESTLGLLIGGLLAWIGTNPNRKGD